MSALPVQMLSLLREGGIRSTAELARRLGVSETLVGMMAEDLMRRGYLAPLDQVCSSGCSACGLAETCHVPATARPAVIGRTETGRIAAGHGGQLSPA